MSQSVKILTLVLLALTSCKKGESESPNRNQHSSQAEWTIMVYVNGDNNLERAAIEDFNQMSKIGSSDEVNIIVQMDLIGVYSNIGWSDTRRFRITKDMDPADDSAPKEKIGEANMGAPETLSDFVKWGKASFPAKKYGLIIWDHGQGWRLYLATHQVATSATDLIDSIESIHQNTASQDSQVTDGVVHILAHDPFRSNSNNPFKSCSNDETSNDELYNREIQDELTTLLAGQKLEVLGFDACLMGMIETAFAMRNIANNLVASEELEPNAGWDYANWIERVVANPAADGGKLAEIFVDSYQNSYGMHSAQTLSATKLSEYDDVARKISDFATSLTKKLPTELKAIKAARQQCAMYAPNPYDEAPPKDYFFHIDIIQFCDRINENTQDSELKTKATTVKNAVAEIVFKNYAGTQRKGNFGSNGLAIYFPASNAQYKSDVFEQGGYKKGNKLYPVEFVEKQKWADFLHSYFKAVP